MIDRYALSPMRELWTLAAQYDRWLEVELAALEAMESLREVPAGTSEAVAKRVRVDLPRIAAVEADVHHDLLAFLRVLEDQAGAPGRFVHQGLTSSDIKDTALSLQMRDGLDLLLAEIDALRAVLLAQARTHQDLVMVGRTHGMHAEPTTLGLKLLGWMQRLDRDRGRLDEAREAIAVGKLSGPVGTYTQVSPQVEALVCSRLRLRPALVPGQIIARDRHAQVLAAIAIAGGTLEQIALEIRHLSRTEVDELEEPAPEGSSSMPHKRNPITSERICGLSRILRANLQATLEDLALWHERDMSHSSVERVVVPDSFLLLHYLLVEARGLVAGLVVRPERIAQNLALTQGRIHSQTLLIALLKAGMPRARAHEAIEAASQRAAQSGTDLLSALRDDPALADTLPEGWFDEEALFDRVRGTSRRLIGQADST